MISHKTHLFSDHPKVPGRLQSAVCHHPQILSWQSHPKHKGTKVLLPQWTKLRINWRAKFFYSQTWPCKSKFSGWPKSSLENRVHSGIRKVGDQPGQAEPGLKVVVGQNVWFFRSWHIKLFNLLSWQQSADESLLWDPPSIVRKVQTNHPLHNQSLECGME